MYMKLTNDDIMEILAHYQDWLCLTWQDLAWRVASLGVGVFSPGKF